MKLMKQKLTFKLGKYNNNDIFNFPYNLENGPSVSFRDLV